MDIGCDLDDEDLESSEPIQLKNKFDSLISEDHSKPCEEDETQEETLLSLDKQELPEAGVSLHSDKPSQKAKPKGRPRGSKDKKYVGTIRKTRRSKPSPIPLSSLISYG